MNGIMLAGFEQRLFDTVVAVTVLFAAALVLTRIVWQPAKRLWIIQWTLIGGLLLVPGLFVSLRPVSLGLVSPARHEFVANVPTEPTEVATLSQPVAGGARVRVEAPPIQTPQSRALAAPSAPQQSREPIPEMIADGDVATTLRPSTTWRWTHWLIAAYAAGAGAMMFRLGMGQWTVRQLVRQSIDPAADLIQAWQALQDEMRTAATWPRLRNPRLLLSDNLEQPVAVGVIRPAVVLPRWLVQSSSIEALRPILAHELAHVARYDAVLRWLAALVQVVFFYHPIFWRLRRELRLCQEYLADAQAASHARGAAEFAEQLVTLLKRAPGRSWRAYLAAGIVEGPSELYRRVQMLLKPARKLEPRGSLRWYAASGVALFVFGQMLCLMTLRADDSAQKALQIENSVPAAAPQAGSQSSAPLPNITESKSAEKNADDKAMTVTVGNKQARQVDPPPGSPPGVVSYEYDEPGDPSYVVRLDVLSSTTPPQIVRMVWYDPKEPGAIYESTGRAEGEGGDFNTPVRVQRIPPGVLGLANVDDDELAGRIVDEQGKPVEGVKVLFWTQDEEKIRTDKDGVFRHKFGPTFGDERHLLVHFVKPGYAPYLVVDWPLGLKNRVIVMETKTYFEGVVRKPDGKPAADALIRANQGPKDDNPQAVIDDIWAETRTDSEGRYKLLVQPDTYILEVRAPGVGTARIPRPGDKGDEPDPNDSALDRMEPQPPRMRIRQNEARHLDIQLESGIDFRAKFVDCVTGKPVPNVRLWHWQHPGVEGRTDKAGLVTVPSLPPGQFTFMLEVPGYTRAWSNDTSAEWKKMVIESRHTTTPMVRIDSGLPFDMAPGMSEATIVMEPCVTVTGRVLDPDGKPVAGATVAPVRSRMGHSLTGDTGYSVTTKDDGSFTSFLPPSDGKDYNLMAHDGGYQEWRHWANGIGPVWQTSAGQTIENVELRLTRPGVIRGRTVDEQGKPLPDIFVHVTPLDRMENSYYIPDTRSDKVGNFELRYVRPGQHLVHGWMQVNEQDAPQSKLPTVEVKAGETTDVGNVFIPPNLREQP